MCPVLLVLARAPLPLQRRSQCAEHRSQCYAQRCSSSGLVLARAVFPASPLAALPVLKPAGLPALILVPLVLASSSLVPPQCRPEHCAQYGSALLWCAQPVAVKNWLISPSVKCSPERWSGAAPEFSLSASRCHPEQRPGSPLVAELVAGEWTQCFTWRRAPAPVQQRCPGVISQ
jgi:hypothetical protein